MVKKIKFIIDRNGEVQLSVEGASGQECLTLTAPFEQLLGKVASRELKDSYYQSVSDPDETSLTQRAEGTHET